jgi:hypothetical protein
MTITELPERIAALPTPLNAIAEQLWRVDRNVGYAEVPAPLIDWVVARFGAVEAVQRQVVVRVINRLTFEGAIFNPLRAQRPMVSHGGDDLLEAQIAAALASDELFRNPNDLTTVDCFGRIRGQYCVTAANIAKFSALHGLVIFDQPHPLRFDSAQIDDYLRTAMRWFAAAHASDPTAIYPLISWNCLPKSGASRVHGHLQMTLERQWPASRVMLWQQAAAQYVATYHANYVPDLIAAHTALGLALPATDTTWAGMHLTPLRNREVLLIAEAATPFAPTETALVPLAATLSHILRTLIDQQGMRAFNLVIALPSLHTAAASAATLPIIARLGDRGDPLSASADLGAIELYAMGAISSDPFVIAHRLRADMQQQKTG